MRILLGTRGFGLALALGVLAHAVEPVKYESYATASAVDIGCELVAFQMSTYPAIGLPVQREWVEALKVRMHKAHGLDQLGRYLSPFKWPT